MNNTIIPLVVITGPTGSGKSGLAIEIAKQFNGEIISADSRAVYRGMDIGTAKPNVVERSSIQHWGIDIVNPNEGYTAADFKRYANTKISEIKARGHLPILVGGTGLYVDAVVFNYQFREAADPELRSLLNAMTLDELKEYSSNNNVMLPENKNNKRHIIRAIETKGKAVSVQKIPRHDAIIVGITTDKDSLRTRIENRAEQIFKHGVIDEAKSLAQKYGWERESMKGNIYPIIHSYIDNELTLEEAKSLFIKSDMGLVKRQLTWMKRNTHIKWLSLQDASLYLYKLLA